MIRNGMQKFFLFMIGIYMCLPCFALTNQTETIIKQAITQVMKKNNVPGVAVEIYQDSQAAGYYFGYADLKKKKPVTKNTIFEIGSLSKLLTSLLFAQEVDNERMKFDSKVSEYIENQNSYFAHIRLQDLATHTAGLPFEIPKEIQNSAQLKQFLTNWVPQNKQGTKWAYSNVGIGLLGEALQAEAHEDINQLYISRILKPLHMNPIGFTVPKNLSRFYAEGHDQAGKPVPRIQAGLFPAAASIKMSANDMQRFLGAAIGLEQTPWSVTFPMRLTQAVYIKLPDKMQGLAWQIHTLTAQTIPVLLEPDANEFGPLPINEKLSSPIYNGNDLIEKTGATRGFRAYIAVIPNKKAGVVLLMNKAIPNKVLLKTGRAILFRLAKLDV